MNNWRIYRKLERSTRTIGASGLSMASMPSMVSMASKPTKTSGALFILHSSFFILHFSFFIFLTSCTPEPPLHLYDAAEVELEQPIIDLDLQVYWDYELSFGVNYDWQAEWYYGWDEYDRELFGELGYTEPNVFNLRRYYTANEPRGHHTSVLSNLIYGTHFQGRYDWGYWDLLVWNDIQTLDGVQSLIFDEQASLDSVTAYTNPSMRSSRYNAPRFTQAFYEPEPLFAAYDQAIEINADLKDFVYDKERNVYVKTLNMILYPITYIYLTQLILHNNRGRVTATDGQADLSGMARTTCLNTGRGGEDAITVYYSTRMKKERPYVPYKIQTSEGTSPAEVSAEHVDIIGGRLMTFGLCNHAANHITDFSQVHDTERHYIDMNLQFNNGMDSTLVFDVTEQVRRHYKGGVLTIELDVDTLPIPTRRGGSGFNAVVQDYEDGGTHEFEM